MCAFGLSVNDARLERGQPPLGFINPLLYHLSRSHPPVFRDIRDGNNRCRTQSEPCCPTGFQAAPGWVKDALAQQMTLREALLTLVRRANETYVLFPVSACISCLCRMRCPALARLTWPHSPPHWMR